MLRKYSEVFRAICGGADLCIVGAAWAASYAIRFHSGLAGVGAHPADPDSYLWLGAAMLPVWHLVLRHRGLYEAHRGGSRLEEARALVEAATLATLLVAAATFFWRVPPISRVALLLFWALAATGLIAFRGALRSGLAVLRRRGWNQRRVLIVGTGLLARSVYERFQAVPETGFRVVGLLGPRAPVLGADQPPVLGSLQELRSVVGQHDVDQVLIALDRSDPADAIKLVRELGDTTAAVRIVLDIGGLLGVQSGLEEFDGLPVLRLIESPLVGWNRVLKRAVDASASAVLLVALSPLLAAIALAVRVSSPGAPALYRQQRMGLDGRQFAILKFRSMIPDAESDGRARMATADDARRTPLGRILRRFNLDELPQLWNVLRGDMSLVGPRPERPELIERFRRQFPGYMLRHKTKAGMTGWAQVHGLRGNTSIEKRLEYDIDYLRRWSLWLDLKILLLTALRGFRDPNAY